ncbi:hypothetical protein Ahia01_001320100 [Argonauta hians]
MANNKKYSSTSWIVKYTVNGDFSISHKGLHRGKNEDMTGEEGKKSLEEWSKNYDDRMQSRTNRFFRISQNGMTSKLKF